MIYTEAANMMDDLLDKTGSGTVENPEKQRFLERGTHLYLAELRARLGALLADDLNVHELIDFRKLTGTAQSDYKRQGRYQRFYGPTEKIGGGEWDAKAPKAKGQRPEPKKKAEPKFTVDDDGEKNFNC